MQVLVANTVILALLYYVEKDLAYRNSYAATVGFTASTVYYFLTHQLVLTGRGVTLTSPPTLDWAQVLVVALVALDLLYASRFLRRPKPPILQPDN